MNNKATATWDIVKVAGTETFTAGDVLAIEEPLEIQLSYRENGAAKTRKVSVTMRTPGNDAELGAGFLFTEGILKSMNEIERIEEQDSSNVVIVHLAEDVLPELKNTERNFYTTSSCGVCGKSSIDAIKTTSIFASSDDAINLQPEMIYSLPDKLRLQQEIF
jgi:FdhD protein